MKLHMFMKSFFYLCMLFLLSFLFLTLRDFRNSSKYVLDDRILEMERNVNELMTKMYNNNNEVPRLKYILQWTSPKNVPFVYMGVGRQGFIERNCAYTNCYVTSNRSYLGDITKFDVIAFHGPEVAYMNARSLPTERSPHQKYAFASIESSDNYPVCSNVLNGFFNWTWTYRLDSEAAWGYMVVRDDDNNIVGPKKNMNWIAFDDMKPTSVEIREKLKKKTKAAAWFVSNCYARSGRGRVVRELQKELKQYELEVDVYGKCGTLSCDRDKETECNEMIERDYYFYLSFENSFAEDYATEKLLIPLKHLAVPIVYGGANYTRFMPDGIYLNAVDLKPKELAEKMNELIKSPDRYAEYFRWRNHYSYHGRFESIETDDYCRFCSMLNEEDLVQKTTIYQNFKEWWNPPSRC